MKKPFEVSKILIPIDFSETSLLALEHASILCQKFKSKLHLLHVYKGRDIDILPDITVGTMDHENVKKSVIEELEKLSQNYSSKFGIEVNIEIREGNIGREITAAAEDSEASMVVMGTHGVSGFEEFFLGSNAYKVVTATKVPVLTVQTHCTDTKYNNILLGIDSSKHSRDKVSHAATLAKAFNAKVQICSLITEEHEEEKNIFNLKIKQIKEYLDHKGVNYEVYESYGDDIAEMLLDKAKELNSDLIAIMTEQEAATGLFMGPYAQRIVNHSKIPVLSITPFEVVDKFSQQDLGGGYRPFGV